MFGDVNRCAAVFTTEGESLQHANEQQKYRRQEADRCVSRQETDGRGRAAHHQQRHEKRIFASNKIADASEKQRTKRTHDKTDRKG